MTADSGIASSSLVVALALVLAASAAGQSDTPQPGLAEQVATARTADDHAALAAAFRAKADEYAADAGEHRRLASAYAATVAFLWQQSLLRLADHCSRAAEDLTAAASELRELGREHQAVAQKLRKEQEGAP